VIPEQAVLRLENPVAFVGEEEEFGGDFLLLEDGE